MKLKVNLEEWIRQFRKVYPECRILRTDVSNSGNSLTIYTEYGGYCDYFRVDEHSVSSAYSTLEEAKRD